MKSYTIKYSKFLIMILQPLEFLNGLLSTALIIGSLIIGLKIVFKYKVNKQKIFVFFGLTWIFLVEPWWPSMISFILVLTTGKALSLDAYLFVSFVGVPFGILSGMTAFTELMFKKWQTRILIVFLLVGICVEIFFLYFLFTNPLFLGQLYGPVDIEYAPLIKMFFIANLPVILIAGVLFVKTTLSSDSPEVKLKGKLLMVGFSVSAVAGALEILIQLPYITATARILGLIGGLFFYWGFSLPNWIKNRLGEH